MNASVMVGIMTLTPYESLLSGFCLSCQSHDCDSIRIDSELVQWPLLSNEKSTTMGPLLARLSGLNSITAARNHENWSRRDGARALPERIQPLTVKRQKGS